MTTSCVKFIRYNENTLSNIITDKIKFSTVYEFNDFNEYHFCGSNFENQKIYDILRNELRTPTFQSNLIRLAKDKCKIEYLDKIEGYLRAGQHNKLLEENENCIPLLIENLAYSSVGIFCMSNIKVFDDDSAQLMFAHYAGNLSGLALIYEVDDSKTSRVNYKSYPESVHKCTGLSDWYYGKYEKCNMSDFLSKSSKWEYENELRLFSKPGFTRASEAGIRLRAILYTSRFAGDIESLQKIQPLENTKMHLVELYPSREYCEKLQKRQFKFLPMDAKRQPIDCHIKEYLQRKMQKL